MPLRMFELNNSIVCIENADIVVKEPRKPITKKKYIGEDLPAKKPAIHPITKQPTTFTKRVPKGTKLEILLFTLILICFINIIFLLNISV